MRVFKIPYNHIDEIADLIARFWWGGRKNESCTSGETRMVLTDRNESGMSWQTDDVAEKEDDVAGKGRFKRIVKKPARYLD